MNTKYEGMDEMDGAGVDIAVAEPVLETPETPEVPAEPETPDEPEKTPEQEEEHKRLTGSARAKAKAERLAEENRQLKERLDRLESKVDPKPADSPKAGEPALDDYASFAEYNAAMIDYRVQKALVERDAKDQSTKIMQSWEQKKAEARKDLPDFDEVLADMEPPAPVVLAVMNASPFTARIAHYLGNHPDEAKDINSMRPEAAALAIGEIAATFKAAKPTEKKESKAPPPLVPVKAAAITVKNDRHSGLEEF
jgi:hypothetical protein